MADHASINSHSIIMSNSNSHNNRPIFGRMHRTTVRKAGRVTHNNNNNNITAKAARIVLGWLPMPVPEEPLPDRPWQRRRRQQQQRHGHENYKNDRVRRDITFESCRKIPLFSRFKPRASP